MTARRIIMNFGMTLLWSTTVTAITVACGASGNEHGFAAKSSTTSPAAAYPQVSSRWDSVVTLSGDEETAARFAAETQVLDSNFLQSNTFDPDAMQQFNQRVAPVYGSSRGTWDSTRTKYPATGGTLSRIVRAEPHASGFDITICEFDSPGLYDVKDGIPVHDATGPRVLSAQIFTVENTAQPSAANKKAPAPRPRLLVVSIVGATTGNESYDTLCDRFAPDPFVQAPPPPLPTTSGPK